MDSGMASFMALLRCEDTNKLLVFKYDQSIFP